MNDIEAIEVAKKYVQLVYADEQVTAVGLEEIEHDAPRKKWAVTIAFSRPWSSPRTRAQEVLENLGAGSSLKRAYKVITIADDGKVLSMKDRPRADAA